jgi:acetyltransferase-like isoleucine patch superfamily enzyme
MSHFIRLLFLLYSKLLSAQRKKLFSLQAVLHHGSVKIAPSAHFDHPVQFQGKGRLIIEEDVVLGFWMAGAKTIPILLQPRDKDALIQIGRGTVIVNGCELIARTSITIGANCRIGAQTLILDADFHGIKPDERHKLGLTKPVVIGDNVWVGIGAVVLKGVSIGKDAIIGTHCVVTKDVPDGAIVVGNPMRIVGSAYS